MSASGLIYAAIAIMWAAVLIPMWLRNHETATENRSAERFGRAMRVLSRKESSAEADHGHEHELREAEGAESAPRQPGRTVREPAAPMPRPTPAPRRAVKPVTVAQRMARRQGRHQRASAASRGRAPLTLAQRRARTLGVLAGLALVMILLSAVTPVPGWAAVPFLLLMAAFVVHLRVQARQKQARRRPATASSVARSGRRERTVRTEPASAGTASAGASSDDSADAPSSSDESGVVQGPSRAVVVERKGEVPASDQEHDASDPEAWRPNPLPLPTYVTAPKAVRPIKVIDLTTPGTWSSGRLLEDDVADEDLLAAQVADEELDALIGEEVSAAAETPGDDSRRAVGD